MISTWENFSKYFLRSEALGISLDFSGMNFTDTFFENISDRVTKAYNSMAALESGAVTNIDENRQVGHYWLRNPSIAPTPEISTLIETTINDIQTFVQDVHYGNIRGQGGNFKNILCIGIGGSALGPQLLYTSLAKKPKLRTFFIDNTDPDGIDSVMDELSNELDRTLVMVTSKSGSTPEPRNAMMEVMYFYEKHGVSFPKQAVAITMSGSKLHELATKEGWIRVFPMFEWIGGRTSVTSSVGLLPAALAGIDIKNFLTGAKEMDNWTRLHSSNNPAMMLALAWYHATNGKGEKDMVVIPYKDRLSNFPKYLQQLIMESLGKARDLSGDTVNQGLTVYGNKGSTDQHSYIQQLRDGINNFFATIIEVSTPRDGRSIEIENGATTGDYLHGFSIGTEQALSANNRQTIVITINKFDPHALGMLIALYERAVGYYAFLIGINAYHQPGVEAGKKAAAAILQLENNILEFFKKNKNKPLKLSEIFSKMDVPDTDKKSVFKILEYLSFSRAEINRTSDQNSLEGNTYTFNSK